MKTTYKALLVGNAQFPRDRKLGPLYGPPTDIQRLEAALTSARTGLHQPQHVNVLRDLKKQEVFESIEEYFVNAHQNEQLLLYYSGHGRLDAMNEFYLCASDTKSDLLRSTAIPVRDLSRIMDRSPARAKVIILDCCHSGSFKGRDKQSTTAQPELPKHLKGKGRFVLTSSRADSPAADASAPGGMSPFTEAVVDAILLGTLDADRDGFVTLDDVYRHVREQLRKRALSEPVRHYGGAVDDVPLARAAAADKPVEESPAGVLAMMRRHGLALTAAAAVLALVPGVIFAGFAVPRLLEARQYSAVQASIAEFSVPDPRGTDALQLSEITAASGGGVWFASSEFPLMGRISTSGRVTETSLAGDPIRTTDGIAIGRDGTTWFTEGTAHKIGRRHTTGTIVEYGTPGTPSQIVASPDGSLWFAEPDRTAVGRISPDGQLMEVPMQAGAPVRIAAAPDGNLWSTQAFGSVGRISATGRVSELTPPWSDRSLFGITVAHDGSIWFTDQGANLIGHVTPAGVFTSFSIPTTLSKPGGIAAGPDGNLWFTETAAGKIGRIGLDGKVTEFSLHLAAMPVSIVQGSDGFLWFTEPGIGKVGRISPSG